jgi:hypothetical protein
MMAMSVVGQNRKSSMRANVFRFAPDSVAKVVLPKVSKILRAAGAIFV